MYNNVLKAQANVDVNTDVNNNLYKVNNQELDNSSFNFKQEQFNIIQKNNPAGNDVATWIRSVDDVKTFEETLQDSDYKEYYDAGDDFDETYTADMAKKALETEKITVYSSYPIKQGIFVSPSKTEAESYSGSGKVYSKEVNINDVAWIDPTQGQYAKVNQTLSANQPNIPINRDMINKQPTISDNTNQGVENNNEIAFKEVYGKTEQQISNELNNIIDNIYKGIMPKGNQVLLKKPTDILLKYGMSK